MKREFKKKQETPKDFTARTLIESLDKQILELEKNNLDIETIAVLIKGRQLTQEEEENLKKVIDTALKLSSTIRESL